MRIVGYPRQPRSPAFPPRDTVGGDLRRLIQTFIRSIGLLAGDQTPCGQPLAVSHAHALMVLLEAAREGNRLTQRELGQSLGIDKSNVARLCRRMESAGHVAQSRSADDGRARLLSLTAVGERMAKNVERSSRDRFEQLMSAIPRRSRAGVLSSLTRLNQALISVDTPRKSRPARQQSADNDGDHR
jgi:DNA-binding MarR family transcriptional regulator